MSQIVQVNGVFPCSNRSWCGGLNTFQIYPINFSLNFSTDQTGSATLSVMFEVNGEKNYQTLTVPPTGTSLTPPANTTHMEIGIQKGTGVPSYLSISVTETLS